MSGASPFTTPITGSNHLLHITLYHRSYPVKGAPVSVSLVPFPTHQRHTFTASGVEHEAKYSELQVVIPDGATVSVERGLSWAKAKGSVLNWVGEKGPVVSTAQEVYDLAHARGSGFRLTK
jgi:hypothetical protein